MTVKMTGPDNHGGFAFRGISYDPDENGIIDVPEEALAEAMSHGFVIHAEVKQADEKLEKPAAAKALKK